MMDEKEIRETFALLGIVQDENKEPTWRADKFLDKQPLPVKFQTTTTVDD